MFFDHIIEKRVAVIREFLADPTQSAMLVRADSEFEFSAAKLIASLDARDDAGETIVFPLAGAFQDPESFYREAEAGLIPILEELREAIAEEHPEVTFPGGVRWDPELAPTIEVRFAEYLERLARGLAGAFGQCLFVLRFDEVSDARVANESLQRLASSIASPHVKLFVLDDRVMPRFRDLWFSRARFTTEEVTIGSDMEHRLRELLVHERRRVSAWTATSNLLRRADEAFFFSEDIGALGARIFHAIEVDFSSRHQICDAVYQAVRAFHADIAPAVPEGLYDMRSLADPALSLTYWVDAILRQKIGYSGRAIVLIYVHSIADEARFHAFLDQLSGAAASLQTRFIIVAPRGVALPEVSSKPEKWPVVEFGLSGQDLEESAAAALEKPDLPAAQRLASLLVLGSFKTSHGEPELALPLLSEAVALSEREGSLGDRVSAWWTLGNGLHRDRQYDQSLVAYTRSAELAKEEDNPLSLAQALLGIGHSHFCLGQFEKAAQAYEVAQSSWAITGQVFWECHAQMWLAETCKHRGDHAKAEELLRDILERYDAMKEPFREMADGASAEVYLRLAGVYEKDHRSGEAHVCRKHGHELGMDSVSGSPS